MVVSMMVVVMLKTIKETSDTDVSTYILTQLHMGYHVCFMKEKGKKKVLLAKNVRNNDLSKVW